MKRTFAITALLMALLLVVSCDPTPSGSQVAVTVNWSLDPGAQAVLDASESSGNAYFVMDFGNVSHRVYVNEDWSWTMPYVTCGVNYIVGVTLYNSYGYKLACAEYDSMTFTEAGTVDLTVDMLSHKLTINYGVQISGEPVYVYLYLFEGDTLRISEQELMSASKCNEYNSGDETLLGWYDDNGNLADDLFVMPDRDASLTARWR